MQGVLSKYLAISFNRLYFKDMPRTLTFQPDEGMRELLEKIAEEKERSLAWVVNYYLRKGLQAEKRLPSESARK